jgi:hypothetical protein
MRAVLQSAVVVGLVSMLVPAWFSIERTVTHDRHAFELLDDAIGQALCGHRVSVPMAEEAITGGDLQIVPIKAMALAKAGSLESFCRDESSVRHGRSPLVWLEAVVFKLRPNISVAGMAKALHFMRLAAVVGFVVLLTSAGYSIALGFGVTLLGFWFLASLRESLFSVSPFGPAIFLCLVALYSLTIWRRWAIRTAGSVMVGAVAGACSALAVRMNWGDPVTTAVLFLVFVSSEGVIIRTRRTIRERLLLAGCFAVTYVGFLRFIEAALPPRTMSASFGAALLFGLCLLCTGSAVVWLLKSRSPAALIAALTGAGACLAQAGAIANPGRWPGGFGYWVFVAGLIALLCSQGLADALWGQSARQMAERQA